MQKFFNVALLALSTLFIASSCTKDPLSDMTEEESRIYITNRDSTSNFGTFKTYSIVDSVSVIDNNRFEGKETTSWDRQVIAAVQTAMKARGFTKVDRTQTPDLGININRLYNTTTNVVDFSNYYNGYGGFNDPYYWGYGGYGYNFPVAYGVYQSTEAALSIDVLDLKNASGNGAIKGIWNGLIRGSGIFKSSNIESQIQVLFNQSAYLITTR